MNKLIMALVILGLSLHTYATDKESEKLECVVQLTPEQVTEIKSIGIDSIKSDAANKDPKAINMLGMLYLSGTLVDKDEELGFGYIKEAAELGRPGAVQGVFFLYFCGLGTEVNNDKGIEWLEKHLENLVETYNINGTEVIFKGSDKYIKTAYILANQYISSSKPEHKEKLKDVIDTLIEQTHIAISSANKMIANPDSIRTVSGTELTNEQIIKHYSQIADRMTIRLDELLNFKKGSE